LDKIVVVPVGRDPGKEQLPDGFGLRLVEADTTHADVEPGSRAKLTAAALGSHDGETVEYGQSDRNLLIFSRIGLPNGQSYVAASNHCHAGD